MTDPPRTAPLSTLQSYRHYRDGTYTLLCLAENSDNRAETMAVYVSHLTRKVLVRPWAMFREDVVWPDGQRRPRFVELVDAPEPEHSAAFYQEIAIRHALAEEAADARVAKLEAQLARVREWHESAPDWPRGLGEILGVPPKLPVVLCGVKEDP